MPDPSPAPRPADRRPGASDAPLPPDLLDRVIDIARQAAARILDFYRTDMTVDRKDDRSPVSEADHAADAIIVPALEALTPDIPVVSEERVADGARAGALAAGRFWLVDPLDGTKEFLAHRDEFTVNIALVEDGCPVLGVLAVPPWDKVYAAWGPGTATVRVGGGAARPIAARRAPDDGIIIAASRSHADNEKLDAFLAGRVVAQRIDAGSALKFCLVAEGAADIYPRFAPTMEWDTAAGQAIVEAAGGTVTLEDGSPLRYGKPTLYNPHFIVRGRGA